MPNIKSAEKWVRQSEHRAERNLGAKTRLKTLFKKAKSSAEPSAPGVASQFDKAAGKGIIHKNKAARKKSRLAKALAQQKPAPAAKSGRKSAARKSTTAARKTTRKAAARKAPAKK